MLYIPQIGSFCSDFRESAPVWLADHRTTPTASGSIDRSSVDFEGGEMSFGLFDFNRNMDDEIMLPTDPSSSDKLAALKRDLGDEGFPDYVCRYIASDALRDDASVCFHRSSEFGGRRSNYSTEEVANIRPRRAYFRQMSSAEVISLRRGIT